MSTRRRPAPPPEPPPEPTYARKADGPGAGRAFTVEAKRQLMRDAVRLRVHEHLDQTEIAARLGISQGFVSTLLRKAAKLAELESVETVKVERLVQQQRLEAMTRANWSAVQRGKASAIGAQLGIESRRAALLGLDAPPKARAGEETSKVLITLNPEHLDASPSEESAAPPPPDPTDEA